ncbi:hypothetical protein EW145_g5336 [Phellinidium pouzarii]|uniref:GPI ethanolamine phosphate transferase 3 n=1 Tax=Phellinidium pouzarii TaxID=167371 RepID=A0A4V3XC68_9AGAM|nr:hypothetical protein EW145_g5336 [Phellinidium pouzarii]
MTYPCEPLNIEDMDSGDDSIIQHLLPLLGDKSGSWDAIVTHFLGVDHVGHRVGPDHPSMKTKLRQMDDVLRRVVDLLEDDTLLVVLGDHGMDRKGDHGGDDTLETSSAMWIYSKGVPLQDINHVESMPSELLTKEIYPDATVAHRSIQQIDIVPTVSLLLGLPIPFNNLGTVIPELFTRASIGYVSVLEAAVKQNARQINQYVGAYRQSSSGSELDILWPSLEAAWQSTYMANSGHSISAYSAYTRSTLEACRSVWAQFNLLRMYIGLTMLGLSVVTASVFYNRLSSITDWEMWSSKQISRIIRSIVSLILPTVIRYFLAISASDKGIVSNFLAYILRPALLAGSAFWILEWVDTMQVLEEDWTPLIRTARTIIGCEVRVFKTLDVGPNAVMVINPNSYGLSFLLFWSIFFAMVYLTSQLTGQVVLALSVVALLAYLEISTLRRLHKFFFTFNQLVALAQLGMHAFYATGHQANVSSMQWKTAFVLTSVVSPLPAYVTIGLNTFGPPAVFAFAAPLLACWKLRPTSGSASCPAAMVGSIRAAVGMMLCYAIILLGSATSATLLREHAMVWKMFAPRFIAAAVDLVFVGIAVIIAVGVGMYKSSKQITRFHDSVEQKGKYKST